MNRRELIRALDEPWLLVNEARRRILSPYFRVMFEVNGIRWGKGWRILGMPLIQRHRGSSILLGDGLSLRSWPASNPLMPNHRVVLSTRSRDASIQIGDDCGFTGTVIVAAEKVVIGNRVVVGANVTITDTDFHPLNPDDRKRHFNNGHHRPVTIEDDVFVGMHAIILKGVTVGRGSVVGAASVVTRDVPRNAIVAGNPARTVCASSLEVTPQEKNGPVDLTQ